VKICHVTKQNWNSRFKKSLALAPESDIKLTRRKVLTSRPTSWRLELTARVDRNDEIRVTPCIERHIHGRGRLSKVTKWRPVGNESRTVYRRIYIYISCGENYRSRCGEYGWRRMQYRLFPLLPITDKQSSATNEHMSHLQSSLSKLSSSDQQNTLPVLVLQLQNSNNQQFSLAA